MARSQWMPRPYVRAGVSWDLLRIARRLARQQARKQRRR